MIISNWKTILKRAWSIRLMFLAAVFSALEVIFPMLEGYIDIPQRLFAGISGILVFAAFIARFVAQKEMKDD